jgi:hypothetical protein
MVDLKMVGEDLQEITRKQTRALLGIYLALRFPMFLTRGVTTHLLGFLTLRVLYPPLACGEVSHWQSKHDQ